MHCIVLARTFCAVLVLLSLIGCTKAILSHTPGTTFGEIKVGSPRVSTRERLVNDRLQQDQWLRRELELADTREFGLQGAVDLRTFSGASTRISGSIDQTEIDRYRQEQATSRDATRRREEQAELDHQILRLQKQRQLQALGQADPASIPKPADPALPAPETKPAAATPPAGPTKRDLSVIEEIAALKEKLAALTLDPSGIKTPERVRPSPPEVLRDKLEYRGMLRNEIIQNGLDDRHDRKGHTLLRLDLDATVFAEHDTSAWAVVDMTIDTAAWRAECVAGDLYLRWVREVHRELRERSILIVREAARIGTERHRAAYGPDFFKESKQRPDRELKRLQFFESIVRSMPDYILLEIQRNWMDTSANPAVPLVMLPEFFPGDMLGVRPLAPGKLPSNYAPATSILVSKARAAATARIGTPGPELLFADLFRTLHLEVSQVLKSLNEKILGDHIDIAIDSSTGFLSVKSRSELDPLTKAPKPGDAAVAYFCAKLEQAIDVFAYGSTPVETVQRVGEVASYRQVNQFLLALNFLVGNTAVGKWYQEFAKVNEGIFQTIRRQPLVVGYSMGVPQHGAATSTRQMNFGWILGPRFTIKNDGRASHFRHGTTPAALSGVISVPGWMSSLGLQVERKWVTEAGTTVKLDRSPMTVPIRVKEDLYSISEALATYSIRGPRPEARQHYALREGQSESIVIPGQNLWRNPVVMLGGQKADDVEVLPDMRGLRATFKDVKRPESGSTPIVVWTSEGHAEVGIAFVSAATKNPPPQPGQGPATFSLRNRQVVVGESLEATVAPPLGSYGGLEIQVKGRGVNQAQAKDVFVLDQGARIRFKPDAIAGAETGDNVTLQLMLKARPDLPAFSPYGTPVGGVYYAKVGENKLKLAPTSHTSATAASAGFTVTFPPGMNDAFPGISRSPIQVALASSTAGAPALGSVACERAADGKTCTFKVGGIPTLAADTSYRVNVTAGGHTLPLDTDTVTFKK